MLKEAGRLARAAALFARRPAWCAPGWIPAWTCPGTTVTKENTSLKKAETILNGQHYGLEKVKERILELFAVKQKAGGIKGQILVSGGPAGRGQDLGGPLHRRSHGAQLCPALLWAACGMRPISGATGRPTSAPCPGASSTALQQAGSRNALILGGRDRQDGQRFPGRPGGGPAGSASTPSRTMPSGTTSSSCHLI